MVDAPRNERGHNDEARGSEMDIRELARLMHSGRRRSDRDPEGDRVYDAVARLAAHLRTNAKGKRIGTKASPQLVGRVGIIDNVDKTKRKQYANWIHRAGEVHDVASGYWSRPDPNHKDKYVYYVWVQYPRGAEPPDLESLLNGDPE